jgi:hypothetical protein
MWKTRTRTKILVIALIWLGLLITAIVIGNLFAYRENAAAIIGALTGGGGFMFVFHVLTVSKENVSGTRGEPPK